MIIDELYLKPKVMLLTKKLSKHPSGGREMLCSLNYECMKDLYGDQLLLYELSQRPLRGIGALLSAFKGYIDGLDKSIIEDALQVIQSEKVGKVLVDGSNLGAFSQHLRERLPNITVVTFFHNVEARFFLGSFRQEKSLKSLAILVCNYLAERRAVKFSDKLICMSERDSDLLKKVYGRAATHLSPMALQDKFHNGLDLSHKLEIEKFALFVGGNFYANRAGITWFVKHVVPCIHIKIYIVGQGFEAFKDELEIDDKVRVVGAVENLEEWYTKSHFVIAPIFDGSGMKTKVAEALMFGKRIVGTPEAFSGYENVVDRAGWCCETADDFIAAISKAKNEIQSSFDPELRQLYLEMYSQTVAKVRLERIMRE